MRLTQSQIALISLIIAILTLLVVAYSSLLPTITGSSPGEHDMYSAFVPGTPVTPPYPSERISRIFASIILDQETFEPGLNTYNVTGVTIDIDATPTYNGGGYTTGSIDLEYRIYLLDGTFTNWEVAFNNWFDPSTIGHFSMTTPIQHEVQMNDGDILSSALEIRYSGSVGPPTRPIESDQLSIALFTIIVEETTDDGNGDGIASLTGIVADPNGIPLNNVNIALEPEGTDISDSTGFFRIRFVQPGTYELVGTLSGYDTFRQQYTFAPDEVKDITITMIKTIIDDDEGDGDEDEDEDEEEDEEEFPIEIVIPFIAAIPVTVLVLGIKFTAFPIRLLIVVIFDGIVAVYYIFFSGVL